jgi:argininosuccinate lyase
MRRVAASGYSTATDLADWLTRVAGLPFREAHHVAGNVVKRAEEMRCALADLPLAEMRRIEPRIDKSVFEVLTVEASVASRTSFGGTAPQNVTRAAAAARKRFLPKER